MARLCAIPVVEIALGRWQKSVRECLEHAKPRLAVLDTFPFGYRGEWRNRRLPRGTAGVLLARRLKLKAYRSVCACDARGTSSFMERVIALEPLRFEQEDFFREAGSDMRRLPGRVRFPANMLDTPIPMPLREALDSGELHLVVHSGPRRETETLIADARSHGGTAVAVVSPWWRPAHASEALSCYDYFPAAKLFARARAIHTGAGYNCVAEAREFPHKHHTRPFERRYDDQAGRLEQNVTEGDGTRAALDVLTGWLESV